MVDSTDEAGAASAQLHLRCACGWETTGLEEDVIEATREHGRRLHNMEATRDEVLAMAASTAEADRSAN